MKFNFPKDCEQIQSTEFYCIHELINDAIETVMESDEGNASVTIVANPLLTESLVKALSCTEVNGFDLTYGIIEINNEEYDNLYYVTITNDGEIWCEQAFHEDNQWHKAGYLYAYAELMYIMSEDVNEEIIKTLGENNILIFDFDENSECESY